jgi:transposase
VYDVQDWAEVRRLHREGWTNTAIAEKFEMSRNTVAALVAREQPPRYVRQAAGSKLDPFGDAIAAMLAEDPKAPATVVRERLGALGYTGGVTILKERLAELRPTLLAARSYQRTSYLPGELAQLDCWETGLPVPVGKGATRPAFALVASLPQSSAHAAVFTLSKTTADFCPALVGCLERLGGVPSAAVDNDPAMVKPRRGGPARLVDEVAALFGALCLRPVVLRPRFPEGKGHDERMVGYLQTSFAPLRRFESSPTSSTSTTTGPPPSPSSGGRGGWRAPWPRRGASSGATWPPYPTRCRPPTATPRSACRRTASCASPVSTTPCPPATSAGGCASSPR